MSRKWWVVLGFAFIPSIVFGQSSADSAAYRKAQALVNDGNTAAGRAIVDSIVARTAPGTNAYAEALYWRAVLSPTAADAEMDYRRIIVDYPVSPRAEDVLLRLAQLELARAEYDGALQHLNRLVLEHPTGPTRARADYWTARVLFEKNDIPHACRANADALSRTSPDDTELRNQISYLNQRCVGVALIADSVPRQVAVDSSAVKADSSARQRAPSPLAGVAPVAAGQPQVETKKPPMKLPATPKDGKPALVNPPVALPAQKTATPTASPAEAVSEGEGYSVQIAAYNVKSQAAAMVARLKKNGYEARVSGSSAPFRVRIGHYATQAQATAVMRSLKAKHIEGFVVKAESR